MKIARRSASFDRRRIASIWPRSSTRNYARRLTATFPLFSRTPPIAVGRGRAREIILGANTSMATRLTGPASSTWAGGVSWS